jgi:hypothetical protein
METVDSRQAELPAEIREIFRSFRNALGGEYHLERPWHQATQNLILEPGSAKKRAVNRIYQILQSRKRKAARLSRQDEEVWMEYMTNLLHDILDILEAAFNES